MRYKEVYELIDAAMVAISPTFPITSTIKNKMFDDNVEALGKRYVRKLKTEEFTVASTTKEYIFANNDVTNQIYRVIIGTRVLPFVPETLVTNPDELNDYAGYYYREYVSLYGDIGTIAVSATNTIFTSAGHGLAVGDYVVLRELVAIDNSTPPVNVPEVLSLEGTRNKVTEVTTDTFTIVHNSGSTSVATAGGNFQQDTRKIILHKAVSTTDGDSTLNVTYYARPRARVKLDDIVDVPERLVRAAMHYSISDLMNIDGKFKQASAHREIGAQHEADYLVTDRNREAMMDVLPNPLPDFI